MSLVGELFAKEFGKKIGKDWRRIMQVLASYNQKSDTFDSRLKISGLNEFKDEIMREFLNFYLELKNKTRICFLNKKYPPFGLVGDEKRIIERIEKEKKRKFRILPYILEKVNEFLNSLPDNFYKLNPLIFLRGSASPRNEEKIFWYYTHKNEKIFISDIDIHILLPYAFREIRNWLKLKARRFSISNKIPINPYVTHYSKDKSISKLWYPLRISLEI